MWDRRRGGGKGGKGEGEFAPFSSSFCFFVRALCFGFVLVWFFRVAVSLFLRFCRVLLCMPDGIGGGTSFDVAPF